MSENKRGWLIALALYGLGMAAYLISEPKAISSGDWLMAAFGLIVPATLIAYVINAIFEIVKAAAAKKDRPPLARWEAAASKRNCYCGLWATNPEALLKEGLPEGNCGTCERCGQLGHARHFPGPVAHTGAWCDRCYRILAWTWPFRSLQGWFLILVIISIVTTLATALFRR